MVEMRNKSPEVFKPGGFKTYSGEAIVISGPPGVGKSTIGKQLAHRIGLPFYDLDELTAKKEAVKTTKEIIEEKGREHFWKTQHACLKEAFGKPEQSFVLALGGGVIIKHMGKEDFTEQNRALVKKSFNICLLPSQSLAETVEILKPRKEDGKRALPQTDLNSFLTERIPQYIQEANLVLFTNNAPIQKVVDAILKKIK